MPELIVASRNTHPAQYIREKKDEEYSKIVTSEVRKIADVFKDKPIWVCSSNLRSDEHRHLKGGNKEPYETDPIIGWRGIRRLLDEPSMLEAEFKAIRILQEQGYKNINFMFSFVGSADEIKIAKDILNKKGFEMENIGIMIETPASCLSLDNMCKAGMSSVCINVDSLTQLALGIDKHNKKVERYFDQTHAGVLSLIESAIKECKKNRAEISACGDISPEMMQFLAKQDIDCIYAKPDAVHKARKAIESY